MFKHESGRSLLDVGNDNIEKIKEILHEKNIPIKGHDLEKDYGRRIKFRLSDGLVTVEKNRDGIITI